MLLVIACILILAAIALYFINDARRASELAGDYQFRSFHYAMLSDLNKELLKQEIEENKNLRALLKKHAPFALQKRVGGKFSK